MDQDTANALAKLERSVRQLDAQTNGAALYRMLEALIQLDESAYADLIDILGRVCMEE